MALSGRTSVNISDNTQLVFSWTAVQDTVAWQSVVSWLLQLVTNSVGDIEATSESPNTVVIDGQTFEDAANIGIGTNETKTLESGQVVLEHNADGTRSFEYSFSQVCNITMGESYVGTVSGGGTGELDRLTADSGDPGDTGDPDDTEDPEEPDESTIQQRKRTFAGFYLLGRCGEPYPFAKKKLVGYSYNGSIPLLFDSYDPKMYPYAILYGSSGSDIYDFYAFTEPVVWQRANNYGPEECDYVTQEYFAVSMQKQEQKLGSPDWGIQYFLWTNTDIKGTDGNVVLAATEPVPVYE